MMEKHIKIGEHYFLVTCMDSKLADLFLRNYHQVNNNTSTGFQPDMTIEIEGNYGNPFLNYDVTVEESAERVLYRRQDYLIEVDSEYKHAKVSVHNNFALKHALMNLYSAFIVHYEWGLLIHSSCAIEGDRAHLFSGYSGAGKSTAAKLSFPRELLSDEATIIKVRKNEVTVFNSPFRSELETTGENKTFPLASIELLHQAALNDRIPVKKAEALPQLIDKVFYWSYHSGETTKIIDLLLLLIKQVPAFQLYFQKNNTFWELISNEKVHS